MMNKPYEYCKYDLEHKEKYKALYSTFKIMTSHFHFRFGIFLKIIWVMYFISYKYFGSN